ncbi:PH domain-containing protein [Oceanidesulfovibrio marinus]|uniref:Bacterial Pleckstrin homology domain-containing protein n=1 Tax=Oceanidesulfovibrio marinus TaxID=370038 RepID=A0A6P1Z9W7_9BACT|nr:PH domain-containing protein [Oceanidesulfovibrio marinus]QJT10469.1 hypothetical protein E8L03_16720 [Oceanidesulfovibrio marinus]TVM30328.1 hypothetical protein DQK91_21245 [Oceanidesulfovibrio marinus]
MTDESNLELYAVPMSRLWQVLYLLGVAATAGAVAWSFKVGFTWSAICLLVVGIPLGALYWYMIFYAPSRIYLGMGETSLTVAAAPFAVRVVPYAEIERVFEIDLKNPAPENESLKPGKSKRGLKVGSYRAGIFKIASGKEALFAVSRKNAIGLRTSEGFIFVSPSRMQHFREMLAAYGVS